MSQPPVPSTIPYPLGVSTVPGLSVGIGSAWDVGIAGQGFLMENLDQEQPFEYRAFTIEGIPYTNPRFDDQGEPGEQSLSQWWTRAQHSWHLGRGQNVLDSDFSSRYRFSESQGVNIWEEGQLTLLKDTAQLDTDAAGDMLLLNAGTALVLSKDGRLWKIPNPDDHPTSSSVHAAGGPGTGAANVISITTDGTYVYVVWETGGNHGIRRLLISDWSTNALVNDLDAELIRFVKGRLMAAKDNNLYEIDLADTAEPDPFFSEVSGWEWTGITEAGPGIYFSGYAGDRSEIYIGRLTSQDLNYLDQATIGALRTVWEAPEGEVVYTIKGYLGKGVLIGTSKGVRVGTISSGEGDLEVSGLVVETGYPVRDFTLQGQYAWFTWEKFTGTQSGLGRIDLGTLAAASDLMYANTNPIVSVADFNGRLFFCTTTVAVKEHATNLVASGYLSTGEIRFGTFEYKRVYFLDVLVGGSGTWGFQMLKDFENMTTYVAAAPPSRASESLNVQGSRFEARLDLARSVSDATLGPTLREWRLRADPTPPGRLRYMVPVMCYDQMVLKNGRNIGKSGLGRELVAFLENLFLSRELIFLQRPWDNDTSGIKVIMEDFQFKSFANSKSGDSGFGGVALCIFRSQE